MKPTHLTSYQDFINQFQKKTTNNRSQHNKSTPINTNKSHYQSYHQQSQSQKTQRIQLTQQKNKHLEKTPTNKSDASISKKSISQMSYNKFINQITQILFTIAKLKGSDLLAHRVSYIQYLQCLKGLKMIRESYQPQPNDLIGQLWSECISKSTIANLILIIGAILKYSNISETQQNKQGLNDYLIKKYQPLKLTRLQLNGYNSRSDKVDDSLTYKFQPSINNRSRYLANKSNSKQNRPPMCSHSAQKLSKEKLNKSKNQILRNNTQLSFERDSQNKIIKEQNSLNLDYTPGQKRYEIKDKSVGKKRSEILYKMAKSTQKRQDKSQNDIQYEKNVKELTFKPHLNRGKSNEKLSKNKIKGQSNSISRVIKGRIQRQIKQLINQKGTTYNEKNISKIRKQKYKEAILKIKPQNLDEKQQNSVIINQKPQPQKSQHQISKQCEPNLQNPDKNIIIVNIFIEQDRAQKLIYYHGHQSLSDAASRFVKQYNLSSRQHQKLIRQLENVMKNTLTSIQQQQQLSTEHC